MISVAAILHSDPGLDETESYSSRGPSLLQFPSAVTRQTPTLSAVDGVAVTGAGGFDNPFFGTSAAAPHVAAISALMLSKNPRLSVTQVRNALTSTAIDKGTAGFDNTFGSGLVDAFAAVNATPAPLAGAPEIVVEQTNVGNRADGGTVDFGSLEPGVPKYFEFTVRNTGNATLTGLALAAGQVNAAEFIVSAPPVNNLAPGASTTFSVVFKPSASGNRTGSFALLSNDADESPFNFNLTGRGVNAFVAGTTVGKPTWHRPWEAGGFPTLLSSFATSTAYDVVSFSVATSGTYQLLSTGPWENTSFLYSGNFNPASPLTNIIRGNRFYQLSGHGITGFDVALTAGTTYHFVTTGFDNIDAAAYIWTINGPGLVSVNSPNEPDIAVEAPGAVPVLSGLGNVFVGEEYSDDTSGPVTITLKNSGTADLTGISLNMGGANPADFVLNSLGATTLAPGASTTFTVTFSQLGPAPAGTRTANVLVASNDPDESPFVIPVSGRTLGTVIEFGTSTLVVNETDSHANITVYRTGSNAGAVGFTITATKGNAQPGSDFDPPTPALRTMLNGEDSVLVQVPILNLPPNTSEPNETFTLTLSAPTGGPALGTQKTLIVRIADSDDSTDPSAPSIASPLLNASLNVPAGGMVIIKGSAADNKEVGAVKVGLNGGPTSDATLTAPGAASTVWTITLPPAPGVNSIAVQTIDTQGLDSAVTTRTFKARRTLAVNVNTAQGSVTAGYTPTSFREIGKAYTITATPKTTPAPGFVFQGWGISGGPTANDIGVTVAMLELPSLTFTMREGLILTANFIPNPFAAVAGTYNGLVRSSSTAPPGGTTPGNSTEGFFTAKVQPTGAFTVKLLMDGFTLKSAGVFDNTGNARFGTNRATTIGVTRPNKPDVGLDLFLDLTPQPAGTGKLTGTVTQNYPAVITAVSDVDANLAVFNGTDNFVPDPYLGAAKATAIYTAILRPQAHANQPPVLTTADYAQGFSFATVTVSKAGVVTFAGVMADGTTPVSISSTLSKNLECPLFAQLYSKGGFLSTLVKFDANATESDMTSLGSVLWAKPYQDIQHYRDGWPEVIKLDLKGAKYLVTANESVIRTPDGTTLPDDPGTRGDVLGPMVGGNVELTIAGNFGTPFVRQLNLSNADVVTELGDPHTYSLLLIRATGRISGSFTHPVDGKLTTFQGMVYQKGDEPGAYGYYLTVVPVPKTYDGVSEAVTLLAR